MKHRLLLILVLVGLVAIQGTIGTAAYFSDGVQSAGNFFQAWIANLWLQTTQGDFAAGLLNQVDVVSSLGDVKLAASSDWYDPAWSYRTMVDINNPGTDLTDYQVRVDITYDADMQPDFDDIRFIDADGSTELPHWRESYIASTSATFWVKVPSVPSGTSAIYMYYGNPAVGTASNGDATFEFFDDFSGDLSKWNIHVGTDIAITASYGNPSPCLEISGGVTSSPYGFNAIGSDATYTQFQDGIIEADIYPTVVALPEIIFRGDYATNTGYKGRWDCRSGTETPWMKPPYNGWSGFGTAVPRFGIADQWQKAKLVISGTTFEIYSNDTLQSTVTDAQYSGPGEIGLANHYGTYSRFDNVRVRQYANPEPSTSVGIEQGQWYNAAWFRRCPIVINNTGSALTDYQVLVTVTYDADMQPDFDDIRFVDTDGSTEFDHWRESYIALTSATFWVEVTSIPTGASVIYMYYGNPAAGSASNGDATFELFDDFEDGDISDWSQYNSGMIQVASDGGNNVLLKTANNDPNGGYTSFNNGALSSYEAMFRTKRINESGGSQNRYGIEDGSFNGYGPRMQDFNSLPSAFAIERRAAGGGSDLVSQSTSAYQWDTWMTVKFRRYGTSLEFELYDSTGSLVESISTSNGLYNSFDRFVVHGGWEFYTDDIIVRKYVNPEPTIGIGAEETIYYALAGAIASPVLDTGIAGATWSTLFWSETLAPATDITFEVRASDTLFTQGDASPSWIAVGGVSPVTSGLPVGRYLQWRANLTTSDTSQTPTLHDVTVEYY